MRDERACLWRGSSLECCGSKIARQEMVFEEVLSGILGTGKEEAEAIGVQL